MSLLTNQENIRNEFNNQSQDRDGLNSKQKSLIQIALLKFQIQLALLIRNVTLTPRKICLKYLSLLLNMLNIKKP